MPIHNPTADLRTHEVTNQPPPFDAANLYLDDAALRDAVRREGADWAEAALTALGAEVASERVQLAADAANRAVPELHAFDRFGNRIDEVEYHPAYHELMTLAIGHRVHAIHWTAGRPGGYVAHAALEFLLTQGEPGICCPVTMTGAAVPALRCQPDLAAEWEPRILSSSYDPRCIPADQKDGVTIGMAMTEKQGGSDVRANTTRARPLGGAGGEYELTGHKWFCSAPMSDAFLTLATIDDRLSCFLVPRWRPDGTRNRLFLQRLKDKLGNRSNASAEIEYDGAWARMVGEQGHGVRTIMEMVQHTRLDATVAPAGMMRQAARRALHHARHRTAFQKRLIDQPLMRNVLADMLVESEAATVLALRIARGFDEAADDEAARGFTRLAVAVGKFWINKRLPGLVCEAMECHGGNGYVEESIMPRLYREAPVNGIWEGSGNVICLDILRAMQREPDGVAAFLAEIGAARGADPYLDAAAARLDRELADPAAIELRARRIAESMALTLQAALLIRHAPPAIADAFCRSRLDERWNGTYGTLPPGADFDAILER